MGPDDTEETEGVDFAELGPVLDTVEFPITADELVERHGDVELERTNAEPITLKELFDFMGDDTFESADGVRQMVMSQMPRDSVGRSNYSDRGGSTPETTDAAEAQGDTSADQEDGESTDRSIDADGERHETRDEAEQ
jgi:hypothetical protein